MKKLVQGSKIGIVGDANVDFVYHVNKLPPAGGEVLAGSHSIQLGGSAANVALGLARLGFNARLLACVGADDWGIRIRSELLSCGVDVGSIVESAMEPTQANVVMVTNDAERTMVSYRGASKRLAAAHVTEGWISGCQTVFLSGYSLLEEPQAGAARRVVEMARRRGLRVVLDVPVVLSSAFKIGSYYPDIDVLVLGVAELAELTGEADQIRGVEAIRSRGTTYVAIKEGPEGASLHGPEGRCSVRGLDVEVLDTTGAGDSFTAGLIAGFEYGLGERALLLLANTMGALATVRQGAGLSLPVVAEVQRMLKKLEADEELSGLAREVLRCLADYPERSTVPAA
ncbi:carbohydrate kinase family protein [Longispora sp. K20-0274]|uniref:carbohydrate kinase family protein n=1 Tax=Longispora sp. K20-0274 TaxID=3088255 RepID=UPI00399AF94B